MSDQTLCIYCSEPVTNPQIQFHLECKTVIISDHSIDEIKNYYRVRYNDPLRSNVANPRIDKVNAKFKIK